MMIAQAFRAIWTNWGRQSPAIRFLIFASIGIGISLLAVPFLPRTEGSSGLLATLDILLRSVVPTASVVLAGCAIARAPQSVMVIGTAAFLSAVAAAILPSDFDTVKLGLLLASAVAAAAAFILLMPKALRRLTISLLILFHFAGIFCAVLSASPPGTAPPWITTQVWTRVFRPYLQYVYLNNAYHFYSPEPGPATLLWFRIEFADGSARWEKIPNRKDARDPLLIEYYRRISLTENAAQLATIQSLPPEVAQKRAVAGMADLFPSPDEIAAKVPGILQYRPLAPTSKRLLASYVRHLVRTSEPQDKEANARTIKVYRIVHSIPHPGLLASGSDPGDRTFYLPFYQGTFDTEGNLIDPESPYLYWLIPILKPTPHTSDVSQYARETRAARVPEAYRDYLTIHAGSSPWEGNK